MLELFNNIGNLADRAVKREEKIQIILSQISAESAIEHGYITPSEYYFINHPPQKIGRDYATTERDFKGNHF